MSLPSPFLARLRDIFCQNALLTCTAECWVYGYDNSKQQAQPDAVVFPTTHEETVELVTLCNEYDVPLTARGRGTGTTGATVPIWGGVVASFERMNRILEFAPDNRYVVVEPGVTNQAVQDFLKPHGFFWPPDPTSAAFCSIGGNLAYNSAGPRAVKYGTPRENTLGLKGVTGGGKSFRAGVYTTKGVVGYDLTRLIIGSEGTLALITEATLKLTPLPQTKRTLRAVYANVESAACAISAIMAQSAVPCALEFIDGHAIRLVQHYSPLALPEGANALLMIEVDGFADTMLPQIDSIRVAACRDGLLAFSVAETPEEVDTLWHIRKALSPTLRKVAPKKINEDVVVPVTALPALISGCEALSQRYQLTIVNFGHAGNGNIHVNLLYDPSQSGETEKAEACLDELFSLVLRLRGTLSGEHGIGLVKRNYVSLELDVTHLHLMRAIKRQFDPKALLNVGKGFPEEF